MDTTEERLERIERKLDAILARGDEGEGEQSENFGSMNKLRKLTPKQHATLQLIMHGSSNREIAEELGITENTAKVHVRNIARVVGVSTRTQIIGALMGVMNSIGDGEYQRLSGGLPKNWASEYMGRDDDPYVELVRG